MAVAAVAFFFINRPSTPPEPIPVFRGGSGQLEPLEPRGDVTAIPTQFIWSVSSQAEFYRFDLYNAGSSRIFTTVTADTIVFTDNNAPIQGYWTVTPLNDLRVKSGEPGLARYRVIR